MFIRSLVLRLCVINPLNTLHYNWSNIFTPSPHLKSGYLSKIIMNNLLDFSISLLLFYRIDVPSFSNLNYLLRKKVIQYRKTCWNQLPWFSRMRLAYYFWKKIHFKILVCDNQLVIQSNETFIVFTLLGYGKLWAELAWWSHRCCRR
jgi:hypothetical protein